jgi:hypothetical protein
MTKDFKETVVKKWEIPSGDTERATYHIQVKVARLDSRRGAGEVKCYIREFTTSKTPEGYTGPTKNGFSLQKSTISDVLAALVEAEHVLMEG